MKSSKSLFAFLLLAIICVCMTCSGFVQGPGKQPDLTITAADRAAVIDGLIKLMNDTYVFPETAAKMEKSLRDHQQKKEYDNITSAQSFVEALTSHVQEISHDKHLRVRYSYEPIPKEDPYGPPSPERAAKRRELLRTTNYGFEKIERLPGNIGYLDMRGFVPAGMGAETANAAMTFLANTDALIIDMRKNGGGDPQMVALIASYLFDNQPVHLNDFYNRVADQKRESWTSEKVAGKRFGAEKPVYILTSNYTFSAAEEFTYDLKNLKRATIIGETTGGGANPGGEQQITDHFSAFIPTGRAINPITKTNWEGTGIKPDVDVTAEKAFKIAHMTAMKKVLEKVTDPERKDAIGRAIADLQKEMDAGK